MRIIALDNYDNRQEGEDYECSDHQARQLIKKGLAKMLPVAPNNKMRPEPANKTRPSSAAGEAQRSSASRAAQASQKPTAQPYPGGGLVTPDPSGAAPARRSRTPRDESSS